MPVSEQLRREFHILILLVRMHLWSNLPDLSGDAPASPLAVVDADPTQLWIEQILEAEIAPQADFIEENFISV